MAKDKHAQPTKLGLEEIETLVDILNASIKLALSNEESYLRPYLPFTYSFNKEEGCIEVIPQGTSLVSAKNIAKKFFKEVIATRTEGALSFEFEDDNKSNNLISSIHIEKNNYFQSFNDVIKYCLPQSALPALEPNQDRLRQLAILEDYHQGKSANHYDSFIFSDEKLFYEKLGLLANGPDIELLCYVVTGDEAAHSQAIKFQKKNNECYFVIMDSLAPIPASPSDTSARYLTAHFKGLGLPAPHIIVNLEGRQGPTVDCWVFALNDGKRMGRQSDLYEKLVTHYTGPLSEKGHQTYIIPPEYYSMTQSFKADEVQLQGIKAYDIRHPEFRKKKVHHSIDDKGDVRSETYMENAERHRIDSQNKKTGNRGNKYNRLLGNKTFMAVRDETQIIHDHNGALITPERLEDIAKEQTVLKAQGIPLAKPETLRLDDIVGDTNLVLILDAVKAISKEHDKRHRLERAPIKLELVGLRKQFGLDITYGQLLDAIENNMKTQKLVYEGGALALLKTALADVGKNHPERWQNLVSKQNSTSKLSM